MACEDTDLEISCPAGSTIYIVNANYGRLDGTTCPFDIPGHVFNQNCRANQSTAIVSTRSVPVSLSRKEKHSSNILAMINMSHSGSHFHQNHPQSFALKMSWTIRPTCKSVNKVFKQNKHNELNNCIRILRIYRHCLTIVQGLLSTILTQFLVFERFSEVPMLIAHRRSFLSKGKVINKGKLHGHDEANSVFQ